VADIVPLVGENRYLVTRGLDVLNRTQRPGVLALMEVAGVSPGEVDAAGIGFRLGPRLNAAGRLESAMLSFELLSTSDRAQAAELAYELNEINQRRQTLTGEMQEIAAELAGLDDGNSPPLLFAADPAFHQGVVGLVASRLTEQTYRPSVVLEQGDEMSHGSCRSIPEFHITEALDRCAGLLVRHGGHAAAAGFTVRNEHIDALRSQLLDIAAEALGSYDLTPTLYIDAEVCLVDLTWDLVDQLTRLEPTGEQNRSPVLATRHLRVVDYRCVGREGNHLKFRVFDGKFAMNAIAFGWGHMVRQMPDYVDLAYHPEINEWRDKRSLQLFIHDIQPSEAPQ
jgi:single-stranded-DNA-specific exonuclease